MQGKILEFLRGKRDAQTIEQIKDSLDVDSVEELKELLKEIDSLENKLEVYRTKKNKYMLFKNSHLKTGKLVVNKKGFGFVILDEEEDVYISEGNMNGAIHGDRVVVEIIPGAGTKLEGKVLKIVERELKQVVGDFYFKKGIGYVDLDDEKVKLLIEVDKEKNLGAVNGSKVLVRITKKVKNTHYKGIVIKVLGHRNDPGVDILAIVYKFGLSDTFSDETYKQLDSVPNEVSKSEIDGRKDLRNEVIFTIDGDDTKDIDDALSFKKLKNGNYLLGVHIADVSYYVQENTAIDQDAFERGTSVYLADRVIPMLPHKLSNGICSLNPNVDRLAMSCEMEIDNNGNIVDYSIFESVINSRKQMTYKNVNKILEENIIPEDYKEYADILKDMEELAKILRKNKQKRGYIDFDIDESKILVDDNGKAIDVVLRDRRTGEMLIEDFMIAANETVAEAIFHMELPFVYRIHGKPSEEKIEKFINFVRVLGYQIQLPKNLKKFDSKDMQFILDQLKDKKEHSIFSKLLLRSMQKAVYDKNNIGHFGLGSSCYTHFTSPIRRYPDTTVHRLLRKYLFENKMDRATISAWDKKLLIITEHSSQKERDSIECEREVDDMKKAEYMMEHIGEKFTGMIVSVMSFGMFVELENGVEGLIRMEDLKDDFYNFDESTFSIKGSKTKKNYRLGDTIDVIVKNASKEAKTVDFILDKVE